MALTFWHKNNIQIFVLCMDSLL